MSASTDDPAVIGLVGGVLWENIDADPEAHDTVSRLATDEELLPGWHMEPNQHVRWWQDRGPNQGSSSSSMADLDTMPWASGFASTSSLRTPLTSPIIVGSLVDVAIHYRAQLISLIHRHA
ncbi:hypothetical protein QYF36_000712 [Acer negundo]|nr:hypothetical protein QYF36_000712 [Acer negundo]